MLADEVPYFLKKYFVKIATQRPLLSCEGVKTMEEYMERPRGVKLINTADGHRLCTLLRRKGLYG